jgi:hypothetical protein
MESQHYQEKSNSYSLKVNKNADFDEHFTLFLFQFVQFQFVEKINLFFSSVFFFCLW